MTSQGAAGTTSLAGRFMLLLPPPLVTGRIEEYDEYNGGSEAERTGGRRNRCLSSRPVGGAAADTETERGVFAGVVRSDTMAAVMRTMRVSNLLV